MKISRVIDRPSDRWSRLYPAFVAALIMVIAAGVAALLIASWPFTTDDAYITLRYSRHLVQGEGLVWNSGEAPVEGFSNFLFVLLGVGALRSAQDPILLFKSLGVIGLLLSLWLTFKLARLWMGPLAALLPCLLLVSHPGLVWWAVSGLETSVYLALSLAALLIFIKGSEGAEGQERYEGIACSLKFIALAGLLVWLAALTRPEGPLLFIAMLCPLVMRVLWERRRSRKSSGAVTRGVQQAGILALFFLIPYTCYFIWRVWYFQRLLPNPVYCKGASGSEPFVVILEFLRLAAPLLPLAVYEIFLERKIKVQVLAAVVLLYLAVLYRVDPILSKLGRYTLLTYAIISILACAGAFNAFRKLLGRRADFVLALTIVLLTAPAMTHNVKERFGAARRYAARMQVRADLAGWLTAHLNSTDFYLIGDAGLTPYLTPQNVLDAYCLNSLEMTSFRTDRISQFIRFVLEKKPAAIVVPSYSRSFLEPHGFYGLFPQLIQQSEFAQNYRHVETLGAEGDTFQYWVFLSAARSS